MNVSSYYIWFAMRIHKSTLENGLRVLVAPKRGLESASIVVGVNFGSMDVGKRHEGLAHYLEHMLFKGTKRRNWSQINEITRKYNIYYNAETGYETTLYEAEVYKRYIRNAMELISDMVKEPRFDKEEFRHELGPIIHEIAVRKEDPDSIVYDNMPRVLFREKGAVMPESISSVENNISMKNLLDAYNMYYNPANSVVIIYGGISVESGIALARKYFSDFRGLPKKPARKRLTPNSNPRSIIMRRRGIERGEVAVGFGCRCIDTSRIEEYVAMNAIAGILNSRLYDQIREVHGLSYDPSVEYDANGTFSCIFASAGGEPSKLRAIKSIMLEEFRKLRTEKIRGEELKTIKQGLTIKYSMDSDDSLSTAIKIAEMELMYGDGRIYKNIPRLIRKLNLGTLRRFVDNYISPERYGSIMFGRAER